MKHAKALSLTGDLAVAVRRGMKTETRRPLHERFTVTTRGPCGPFDSPHIAEKVGPGTHHHRGIKAMIADCAKYKVGDVVWVREPGRISNCEFNPPEVIISYFDNEESDWIKFPERLKYAPVIDSYCSNGIFKEAARTYCRITDVNLEFVSEMTQEKAILEGFASLADFWRTWLNIYPMPKSGDRVVWVYKFEVIQ